MLVAQAVRRTQDYLLGLQDAAGWWWGELASNPTMEAEYLLLTHFLGAVDRERWRKIVNYILSQQRPDGGWGQYYAAPDGDVSTSVECYFALKVAGVPADAEAMRRARAFILGHGGVPATRVFTKIWLALFGQWEWRAIPVIPPEIVLLPPWFPINIYEFSSWSRATIVPLTIVLAYRPLCPIPPEAALDEVYPVPKGQVRWRVPRPRRLLSRRGLFWLADAALRWYEGFPWKPLRPYALRLAERWVVAHQEADGSWGGIQPPWVYSLIALKVLGYPLHHPVMAAGLRGFEAFAIEEGDTWRVQACVSPVWDTCLTMIALLDSGLPPDHPALQRAARWLLSQEIRIPGDWAVKVRGVEPSGWAFEFENDLYPDIDDTAEVLMALYRTRLPPEEEARKGEAIARGVRWLLAMQSRNGGWGAFDKDNTREVLAHIPFADFGEVLDPPSEDVTAHVVEALGRMGFPPSHPSIRRALAYLLANQEFDGAWFGRWGVNTIYGVGAVLPALEAVGEDMGQPAVRRAVAWLLAHQNPDGGWGETCASYADFTLRGKGPSTASQTAWALLALLAAGLWAHPATLRGLEYLVRTQRADGTWDEPFYTGTGFPGYGVGRRLTRPPRPGEPGHQSAALPYAFMINYHLYRIYWPLMALGRWLRWKEKGVRVSTANAWEVMRP